MLHQLFNHLWQSTIFAGVLALLTLALRKHNARTRHRVWLAASVKFLLPFALLTALGSQVSSRTPLPPIAAPKFAAQVDAIALEWTTAPGLPSHPSPLPTIALILWAAGTLFLVARWTAAWLRLRAVARAAVPLPLPFPIPVRSTTTAIEPGVFGIFRPVLLLPAGIADRLSPAQFQAILDHEAAHVRRRDNLWSALHMIIEAIFWFHPLVWWIGARLSDDRERACDEAVLGLGSRPETYAESILAACKLYLESPLPCVSGVTGADLKKRIERIMTDRIGRNLRLHTKLAIAAGAVLAIGLPIAAGLLRAQATPSLAFEVASIKPSAPNQRGYSLVPEPGGGLKVRNTPLGLLIGEAFGAQSFQLSGIPSWANSARYDIDARASDPKATRRQIREMLATLLADRFHLATHRETRDLPVYSLVVAKGGSKMTLVKDPPERHGVDFRDGGLIIIGHAADMPELAEALSFRVGRRVTDQTGLAGRYDFRVEFTPDEAVPRFGDEHPAAGDPDGSSLFTALQEQIGLRLQSGKGPVEMVVVDRVERPTEN